MRTGPTWDGGSAKVPAGASDLPISVDLSGLRGGGRMAGLLGE